jgi:hypothetical protein
MNINKRFIPGIVLILIGVLLLLRQLHVFWFHGPVVLWGLLAALGFYRLVLGLRRDGKGVVFGSMAAIIGSYMVLHDLGYAYLPHYQIFPGMMMLVGVGVLMTVIAAPRKWHNLVPAFLFIGFGAVMAMAEEGMFDRWEVMDFVRMWWPVGLILFGIALLVNRMPSRVTMTQQMMPQ